LLFYNMPTDFEFLQSLQLILQLGLMGQMDSISGGVKVGQQCL
jgi:hypothetical protein